MFCLRRPAESEIAGFITGSQKLPLTYAPVGLAQHEQSEFKIDEATVVIGHGEATFRRAKAALAQWRQFELGWVELFPRAASIEPGTVVAVLVHHLGFWSLNGCRVVYSIGGAGEASFGFGYGTLTNHCERGEELFEVSLNSESGEVIYRIRAASQPRAILARIGYPLTRGFQARFRRDSLRAMKTLLQEQDGRRGGH